MSTSPNIQSQTSPTPPLQTPHQSEPLQKVVVPLPVIQQNDDIYHYVFVRGSLYSSDTQVFGLSTEEIQALSKRFNSTCKTVENGVTFQNPVAVIINSLAQLGYKVVCSCGETETIFTMQREV